MSEKTTNLNAIPQKPETPSKPEKKARKRLDKQLNGILGIPKDTNHEWQITDLRDDSGLMSWADINHGDLKRGVLIVTKFEDPASKQEVLVAATELRIPEFTFGANLNTAVFGVIVPRSEEDNRKGYDSVLRLTADMLPSGLLPEYTVDRFFSADQFQRIVVSKQHTTSS